MSGAFQTVAASMLLLCACGSEEARAVDAGVVVGAGGATVSALGGAVTLEVPAGAVAAPTPISVVAAGGTPLDPRVVGGSAVTVSFDGALAVPATLSVSYDMARAPFGLPESRLRMATLDGAAWADLAGSAGDPATHRAQVALTGAGTFSVRQADPSGPCTRAEDRQFDFWLGTWSVTFVGDGTAGSEITRDAEGCNVYEHFIDVGNNGRSVSFYNADTGKWYQTYIDDAGGRVLLGGTFENGVMLLATDGSRQQRRITWSQEGDKVRQHGERTINGGATWTTEFDGIYTRVPGSHE